MSDESHGIGYVPHFSTPVEGPLFLFSAYYIQQLQTNIHQLVC